MQAELVGSPKEMNEQQILGKIANLEKTVEDADDRTLRLGDKTETLKDFVHTDVNVRLVRVDERSSNIMWAVGILAAAVLGSWVQLLFMSGRLSGMERDVSYIAKGVDELRLKKTAEKPTSLENIQEAKEVLAHAKTAKIAIPSDTIKSIGKQFIDASQTNPDAWDAAMAFLDYKSFLNIGPGPVPGPIVQVKVGYTAYQIPRSMGPMYTVGDSKPPDVPQFRPLDQPNLNEGKTYGPKFLVVNGGEVTLDSYYLKNIVLNGVHVVYRGGPTKLDNVYFVNCTFDVAQQPKGQELAAKLLESGKNIDVDIS